MSINKQIGVDHIYIVHGIKGYEAREKNINNLLRDENRMDFEFVTESWQEEENQIYISKYFTDGIKSILSKGALYCTLVHFKIYERFLESKSKYAIIFENDVFFLNSFVEKIKLVVEEANSLEEGFIISLENSTLQFPPMREVKKNKYLYEAHKGRCAGAYLIDRVAAINMLNDLNTKKCRAVIDWWHNDLISRKVVKMYWAHPPLTEQGSFNGKLPSSISQRSAGWLRQLKWSLQKFYKMYVLRSFK